jgi:hypothetical protein
MQHAKSPERMHILAHTANVMPTVILKIKSSFMALEYKYSYFSNYILWIHGQPHYLYNVVFLHRS